MIFAGTKFYQQKLPAWRPSLTSASTTIPSMIVIGLVYICIGMAIHYTANGVCKTSLVLSRVLVPLPLHSGVLRRYETIFYLVQLFTANPGLSHWQRRIEKLLLWLVGYCSSRVEAPSGVQDRAPGGKFNTCAWDS